MPKARLKKQMRFARKKGLSPLELAQMQAIAKSNAIAMQEEATWNAFKMMIAVSVNVLGGIYWPKTANKRVPEYVDHVIDIYDAIVSGAVSYDDVKSTAEEYGYKFEDERILRTEERLVKKGF